MMVRTAVPSTTAQSSPRTETTVELLDRTGIIAASLPQRRRTEHESDEPPLLHETRSMDHRPRSVVIRRRAKVWAGAAAAVSLLAVGWLAGGAFSAHSSDSASQLELRQDTADRPAVVVPVTPPATTTTATEARKVPVQPPVPNRRKPTTPKAKTPRSTVVAQPPASARADVPADSSEDADSSQFPFSGQMKGLVLPFLTVMSGR
jgi:hypothetical protein